MNAGDLKHRIQFQEPVQGTDGEGYNVPEWKDCGPPVWAAARDLYGKEFYEAAAVQMENTVKFIIRGMDGISTALRIVFQGRAYDIFAVDRFDYASGYITIRARTGGLSSGEGR